MDWTITSSGLVGTGQARYGRETAVKTTIPLVNTLFHCAFSVICSSIARTSRVLFPNVVSLSALFPYPSLVIEV